MRRLVALLLALPSVALAEDAWTTRAVDALRWPGQAVVSAKLEAGTRVVVVVRDAGLVRVRHESDFGWVPEDALSGAPPAEAPTGGTPAAPAADPAGGTPAVPPASP